MSTDRNPPPPGHATTGAPAPDAQAPGAPANNQRDLEAGIHTDLEGRMTYGGYLRLDLSLIHI